MKSGRLYEGLTLLTTVLQAAMTKYYAQRHTHLVNIIATSSNVDTKRHYSNPVYSSSEETLKVVDAALYSSPSTIAGVAILGILLGLEKVELAGEIGLASSALKSLARSEMIFAELMAALTGSNDVSAIPLTTLVMS